MITPWGKSDHKETLAVGITFYGTPSHGGIKVNKAQNEKIHPAYRNDNGWYEEDCECLKVIFTFPHLFPKHDMIDVCLGLKRWFPTQTETVENDLEWQKNYIKS